MVIYENDSETYIYQLMQIFFMKCERCSRNEGEYLCSECKRVVCSDCKVINQGKVYCLDHSPVRPSQQNVQAKPPEFKSLKEVIYADLALLIGLSVIFFISNSLISGMIVSNLEIITQNFPQLASVFTLLAYFNSFGIYAIITLVIILIVSIAVLIMKKRKYKNI